MKKSMKNHSHQFDGSIHETNMNLLKEIRLILAENRLRQSSMEKDRIFPPLSRGSALGDRFGRGEARLLCMN